MGRDGWCFFSDEDFVCTSEAYRTTLYRSWKLYRTDLAPHPFDVEGDFIGCCYGDSVVELSGKAELLDYIAVRLLDLVKG